MAAGIDSGVIDVSAAAAAVAGVSPMAASGLRHVADPAVVKVP